MNWLLVTLLALATAQAQRLDTCHAVDDNPYVLFGDKTAYIFGSRLRPVNNLTYIPGCKPIAIWLANRHGTTNPQANEISELQRLSDFKNNIISNYRNGNFRDTNRRMCAEDITNLERWQWNPRINLSFAGDLTSEGYMTTQQLAMNWKNRFPGLFTNSSRDYLIKYANNKLMKTSFLAFTEGLFGTQANNVNFPVDNDEKKFMPYKYCPSWQNDIEKNNDTLEQMRIFQSKQEYDDMITNISLRLGFGYKIQYEFVNLMYDMCRYEKAWDVPRISPWCAAFTREDLKRLEYAGDLLTYYKYGYGNPMSQKIGCTAVKDMIDFFNKHIDHEQPQEPKVQVQLTDSAMVLMLLTTLNARHDIAPLTGDNYHTNAMQSRKWTTSTMSPFNANVAAVLYKCTSNGNFQIKDRYQVLFLENEKPMYLEGCRVGLCDWSLVTNKYSEIASKCDTEFCNSATKTTLSTLGILLTVSFVVFIS